MVKHNNKQMLAPPTGLVKAAHSSVFWEWPNSPAARGLGQRKEWFWKGLERFVNTDDSAGDYHALAKAFPSFWPLPLNDNHGNDLAWSDAAHRLFKFYRNVLRWFWTRERGVLKSGVFSHLLFGTFSLEEINRLLQDAPRYNTELDAAFLGLRTAVGKLQLPNPAPLASFWPDWNSKTVLYCSVTDFQRAIWTLFLESWRSRVCLHCGLYFIAAKPPQFYCSVACSNRAHQANSLRWWREKGASRRAARNRPQNRRKKQPRRIL